MKVGDVVLITTYDRMDGKLILEFEDGKGNTETREVNRKSPDTFSDRGGDAYKLIRRK